MMKACNWEPYSTRTVTIIYINGFQQYCFHCIPN